MTLLDAYALVAFLVGGPAAGSVRALLREGDAAVATANLAEALDVSERVYGLSVERSAAVVESLIETSLRSIPLEFPIARRAAELRARHYHRKNRPISLADAILVASAGPADRVATADPDVIAVCGAESVEAITLPEQG